MWTVYQTKALNAWRHWFSSYTGEQNFHMAWRFPVFHGCFFYVQCMSSVILVMFESILYVHMFGSSNATKRDWNRVFSHHFLTSNFIYCRISEHSHVNGMTADNLGRVLTPTLFRPVTVSSLVLLPVLQNTLTRLTTLSDSLFSSKKKQSDEGNISQFELNAVLERVSVEHRKLSIHLLCFCFTETLCDWLKKTRVTLSTNEMQSQNQSRLGRTRFPALSAGYVYLLRVVYFVAYVCWLCSVIL